MAHFILVHGMFHGGWSWDRVRAELEARGHTVDAPDLAGCGSDRTDPAHATLEGWAAQIALLVQAAADRGARPVLVGHSRGGLVISQAAERCAPSLCRLIYVTALMLPDGLKMSEIPTLVEKHGIDSPPIGGAPVPNSAGTALLADRAMIGQIYGGVGPDDFKWAMERVTDEPLAPLRTRLSLSEKYRSVPRVYVRCVDDDLIPVGVQDAMIAESPPVDVVDMAADHMVILTRPVELAAILESKAADCPS